MPEGWEWSGLRNAIELISERDLKSDSYSDSSKEGIPYITGANNFKAGTVNTVRTTQKPSVFSRNGDILISVKGTIGELAINPYDVSHIARQVMAI
ncbi:restriction endonuclease subunit S [Oceanobacillus sp. AG]|uniref:restriction endonuclease subunit S n=1 Tax=Oceanobacillus sp. AG TaxID=2681969 RepID=UPI0012EB9B9E|nr:restriction endonuclease subunit S [Oceanobacillus sp. AG]